MNIYHYTDKVGYNAVRARPIWVFKAYQPPKKENPVAAYFSGLHPQTPLLAAKLRVGKKKIAYVFEFDDSGDLKALSAHREMQILYHAQDYAVSPERQRFHGPSADWRP